MPSKTEKQKSFMAAIASNPEFAKKVKVPQKVGKEYAKADKKVAYEKSEKTHGNAHEKKESKAFEKKEHKK